MAFSMFDLFKIGVGPSSSHTVGPMVAGNRFADQLRKDGLLEQVARVSIDLYGSLALTGKGHATDIASIVGLMAETPSDVDPDQIPVLIKLVRDTGELALAGEKWIYFDIDGDLQFHYSESLPEHPNGMILTARDEKGETLLAQRYFSVGGGFVVGEDELDLEVTPPANLPYPFDSAKELLAQCQRHQKSISEMVLANELAMGYDQAEAGSLKIWQVMDACIQRGLTQTGVLPGSIKLKRRANEMHQHLLAESDKDHLDFVDWVNLFAMAVNEENAAGGRVVTAPTNGAAGVIPAVIAYYNKFISPDNEQGIVEFLTTSAAIGLLYKHNASISAAEVGCQGEIGVACSMAAAGLTAAMGGTPEQIENAAEIGMEHNLGLTCDPIDGLVQVPCIERNTMGAIKAINASRLALRGDGSHHVHLDDVIKTMHQTGLDMMSKYKETSQGGLAINVIAC